MNILLAIVIAVLVGIVAYVLFSIFPPTKPYASPLSLVAAILTFLVQAGMVH